MPGPCRVGGKAVALLALSLAAGACIDPLLGPEPDPTDSLQNFDILWREFDRYYPFFEIKDVDWDALRAEYRPRVPPNASEVWLLTVVSDMLDELEDGHLNVFTAAGVYGYAGWYADRPLSFDRDLAAAYCRQNQTDGSVALDDGRLVYCEPQPGIGYVRIRSFAADLALALDTALEDLAPLDGLILDLRHNTGGSDREAREAAGRMVDARRLYRTVRIRNGPGHHDFSDPIPSYVEPMGPRQFQGPVVVLTNRRTFSAAESFILAVRTRAAATIMVGDTTGGGSGFPMLRELPNGWTYRISRWISRDADGRTFEGVGLAPDEVMVFDEFSATDPILGRAIEILTP